MDTSSLIKLIVSVVGMIASHSFEVDDLLYLRLPEIGDYHVLLIASLKYLPTASLTLVTVDMIDATILKKRHDCKRSTLLGSLIFLSSIFGVQSPRKSRRLKVFLLHSWPELRSMIEFSLCPSSIDSVLILLHNWLLDPKVRSIIERDIQFVLQVFVRCLEDDSFFGCSKDLALRLLLDVLTCLQHKVAPLLPSVVLSISTIVKQCDNDDILVNCLKLLVPAARFSRSRVSSSLGIALPMLLALLRSPRLPDNVQIYPLACCALVEAIGVLEVDVSKPYVADVYSVAISSHLPMDNAIELILCLGRFESSLYRTITDDIETFFARSMPIILIALRTIHTHEVIPRRREFEIFRLLANLLEEACDIVYMSSVFDPLCFELLRISSDKALIRSRLVDKSCVLILLLHALRVKSEEVKDDFICDRKAFVKTA
ncbi:hypothetical protein CVT26_009209 [Gymnopilus dilepis]|uniref:Uncharacterized protein n=1 Tax=Gymnopilus dilepis TaxID=231916 RepID=A0A409WCI3_9AGAR|nr:hypothetical protein CVT26_009209 [Gymnopilus dilepis]